MSPRALTQAEDAEATYILAHPYDHPADEVDRAERHLAHNAEHVARREAVR